MARRKSEADGWRRFWNSIGGAEIDPRSLKPARPAPITQKELRAWVDATAGIESAYELLQHARKTDTLRTVMGEVVEDYERIQNILTEKLQAGVRVAERDTN